MKGNQVSIPTLPVDLVQAQKAAFGVYSRLCDLRSAQLTANCFKDLSRHVPLYSIILTGPDSLAKAAILTGVRTYERMGQGLLGKVDRLNLLVKVDVLSQIGDFPQELLEAARKRGDSQVMVMVKGT